MLGSPCRADAVGVNRDIVAFLRRGVGENGYFCDRFWFMGEISGLKNLGLGAKLGDEFVDGLDAHPGLAAGGAFQLQHAGAADRVDPE